MKMVCEVSYGPKDHLLGEDAHFICSTEQIIGVADGVGGWAKKGIDAATQQKAFNMPYQLGNTCDTPTVAVEVKVEVEVGDIIILGTDGVWDNIFVWEMEQVLKEKTKIMDLKNLSSYIASLALYNSFDKFRKTPFSIASTEAGKPYRGGKFDDITVVIGRIINCC
ncbi:hypothetical protein CsatA_022160 [Cannabis sativa]